MKKYSKGFTLIELLVVIAIIGILSSVVLASLNTARVKARDARRIADINSLQLALELYSNDFAGKYPLATTVCTPGSSLYYGLQALVPTYISKIPTDPTAPTATSCYEYASGDTAVANTMYHIGATLENSAGKPSNDVECDSTLTTGGCFGGVDLDNGFVGTPTALYDLRN